MGLTGSQIEERFRVIPETGEVFGYQDPSKPLGWVKPGNQKNGGGYHMVTAWIDNKRPHIRSHHLVWAWVHGEWPDDFEIDHINGNRSDNRIENLRKVTVSQNRTNKKRQTNNKSGFKWVYKCCQRDTWRAEVSYRENGVSKKFRTSGHSTPDAAYEIASKFARSVHGKFYNPG